MPVDPLVARPSDAAFTRLPDHPFAPHHLEVDDDVLGHLRVHYVDEGPPDAEPVLLVHGQPTWSYLYRHVIARLVERGHRVVAPDNIGFGRSDKPTNRYHYTLERHIGWHRAFVERLDLRRITVVGQDWGGTIGFGALAALPDRYARAVATNTILHCADPSFAGRLEWANHGIGEGRVVVEERLLDHILASQRSNHLDVRAAVARAAARQLSKAELDAYEAPFPDERHRAGLRQMNALIPVTRTDPGAAVNRATWDALSRWHKPFLTAFSDLDVATRGFDALFQERVPGAAGRSHVTVRGARHFVQEDRGAELADVVSTFVEET